MLVLRELHAKAEDASEKSMEHIIHQNTDRWLHEYLVVVVMAAVVMIMMMMMMIIIIIIIMYVNRRYNLRRQKCD